jgi:hypothetical protein
MTLQGVSLAFAKEVLDDDTAEQGDCKAKDGAGSSIWLQGSRGTEDFAPDDGLAEGCGGFDFEQDLLGLGRSWLELTSNGARRGCGR